MSDFDLTELRRLEAAMNKRAENEGGLILSWPEVTAYHRALRNAAPALFDELERLRAELAHVKEFFEKNDVRVVDTHFNMQQMLHLLRNNP